MKPFIEDTQDGTPLVHLDADRGIFLFEGKSLPENADEFFDPVIEWFKDYINTPNQSTRVVFKMDFFDTASSKKLLDMLFLLKDITSTLTIEWYYFDDDDDMEESGKDFESILEMNFKMIPQVYAE